MSIALYKKMSINEDKVKPRESFSIFSSKFTRQSLFWKSPRENEKSRFLNHNSKSESEDGTVDKLDSACVQTPRGRSSTQSLAKRFTLFGSSSNEDMQDMCIDSTKQRTNRSQTVAHPPGSKQSSISSKIARLFSRDRSFESAEQSQSRSLSRDTRSKLIQRTQRRMRTISSPTHDAMSTSADGRSERSESTVDLDAGNVHQDKLEVGWRSHLAAHSCIVKDLDSGTVYAIHDVERFIPRSDEI